MTTHVLSCRGELYAEGERTDLCPYCDLPVSGEIVDYGGPMHKNCYLRFGEEMNEICRDDWPPVDNETDEDWVQPESETEQLQFLISAGWNSADVQRPADHSGGSPRGGQ